MTCCTFVQALVREGDGSVESMIAPINPNVLNVDIKYSATSITLGLCHFLALWWGGIMVREVIQACGICEMINIISDRN